MRKLLLAGSLMALLVPATSSAQLSLGLRVGFAPALGTQSEEGGRKLKMSDGFKSQVPIQIDALYRITPQIAAGAYFSYGFGQVAADGCSPGAECSVTGYRFGVQGVYSFSPIRQFVPWAGAGIGYEIASAEEEAAGVNLDSTVRGFEFLSLQGGADYKVSEQLSVGPYVQLSIAQYSRFSRDEVDDTTGELVERSGSIPDKGVHEWLGFGIRGKFDL